MERLKYERKCGKNLFGFRFLYLFVKTKDEYSDLRSVGSNETLESVESSAPSSSGVTDAGEIMTLKWIMLEDFSEVLFLRWRNLHYGGLNLECKKLNAEKHDTYPTSIGDMLDIIRLDPIHEVLKKL